MKHKICTLLLCLLAATAVVQAQTTFGAKGGVNIASTTYKETGPFATDNAKARLAFYLGVYANRPVNEKLSIQPELLFSSQGLRRPDQSGRTNWRNVTNYLSIPIMAQYKINDRFYAEAGPQIGILLSSTAKWKEASDPGIGGVNAAAIKLAVAGGESGSRNTSEWTAAVYNEPGGTQSTDTKSSYKTLDLGLGIGAGYEIAPWITATARYTQGLVNTFKNSTMSNKNTLISLGIAYKFSKD